MPVEVIEGEDECELRVYGDSILSLISICLILSLEEDKLKGDAKWPHEGKIESFMSSIFALKQVYWPKRVYSVSKI